MKVLRNILTIASLLAVSQLATAWDGTVSGTLNSFHSVPSTGNYDLRITLNAVNTMCTGNTANFAYLNSHDANFKGVMATLLMAYSMNKTVTVYTNRDAAGYCAIGYIYVTG
jgi:hypothetical protein